MCNNTKTNKYTHLCFILQRLIFPVDLLISYDRQSFRKLALEKWYRPLLEECRTNTARPFSGLWGISDATYRQQRILLIFFCRSFTNMLAASKKQGKRYRHSRNMMKGAQQRLNYILADSNPMVYWSFINVQAISMMS